MEDEEIIKQVKQYLDDNPKVLEILKQFNIDYKQYAAFINQMSKPTNQLSSSTSQP